MMFGTIEECEKEMSSFSESESGKSFYINSDTRISSLPKVQSSMFQVSARSIPLLVSLFRKTDAELLASRFTFLENPRYVTGRRMHIEPELAKPNVDWHCAKAAAPRSSADLQKVLKGASED